MKLVQCGGFNCKNIFQPRELGNPAIYICPYCEDKMNKDIKIYLHVNTGNIYGHYNPLEKINGSLHLH